MIFYCIIEDLMIIYLQTFFHTLAERSVYSDKTADFLLFRNSVEIHLFTDFFQTLSKY